MNLIEVFKTELKDFSKRNWWVFILYILLLIAIYLKKEGDLISVIAVTSMHFIADIFIMMMSRAYVEGKFKRGTYFQITSMILFLITKIYQGVIGHVWHYLAADPIYILAAYKNYKIDVSKKKVRFNIGIINYKPMLILSGIIIISLIILKERMGFGMFENVAECVQVAGIFLFAVALSITENEPFRYRFSIVALFIMVIGSAWVICNSLIFGLDRIKGLELSYFLLPLTVLVFYLKNWNSLNKASRPGN